ncbi:MAG: zf-HC2 domain-containing protein [Bacteroidetes bacterium]|nr:zf-HC2 domain-containing protein [Rhodothermia bacterium]MCS7155102.1 zf-HC2 domain-containing protein [Bacteroidota bacterium]MCX7907208.1 zf-HC2 domain-containing protein [Bacteroidota bacterium]MDW8138721.1 zf-HC2 domain-containing protein [Bacteroidota bacterium]MDW8286056.1 zf-HC2 domain-containing protein [Bacteroidota bacterium]
MSCRQYIEQLCEHFEEALDRPECARLREHLEACPECRAYLDSLRQTIRLYRQLRHQAPEDLCRRLLQMLALEEDQS